MIRDFNTWLKEEKNVPDLLSFVVAKREEKPKTFKSRGSYPIQSFEKIKDEDDFLP
jgi:hypothetical protein